MSAACQAMSWPYAVVLCAGIASLALIVCVLIAVAGAGPKR